MFPPDISACYSPFERIIAFSRGGPPFGKAVVVVCPARVKCSVVRMRVRGRVGQANRVGRADPAYKR